MPVRSHCWACNRLTPVADLSEDRVCPECRTKMTKPEFADWLLEHGFTGSLETGYFEKTRGLFGREEFRVEFRRNYFLFTEIEHPVWTEGWYRSKYKYRRGSLCYLRS